MSKLRVPVLILFAFSGQLIAQTIGIKTIPSISNDHLFMHPSYTDAMGDISIAVDDELTDVFVNPAKVLNLRRAFLYFMPNQSRWSTDQNGFSGRDRELMNLRSSTSSLPVGFLDYGDGMFSGVSFEYQWLRTKQLGFSNQAFHIPVSAILGFEVIKDRLAFGGGLDIMVIEGVEGFNLLYPGSSKLKINGTLSRYRIGMAGSLFSGDDYSIVGLYHKYNVEEKARYPKSSDIANENRYHGWVLSAEYRRMLSDKLRAGIQLTGNWKTHDAIPNYPISGSSAKGVTGKVRAFDLGLGFSWMNETTLLGLDLIFEPIAIDIPSHPGMSRLLYRYSFHNRIVRLGMETRLSEILKIRFGVNTKMFQYDLVRFDPRNEVSIRNEWTEVVLTAGASIIYDKFEFLPCLRMTNGTGIVSSSSGTVIFSEEIGRPTQFFFADGPAESSIDIIVRPGDDLVLKPVPVFVFQMSVIYWMSL